MDSWPPMQPMDTAPKDQTRILAQGLISWGSTTSGARFDAAYDKTEFAVIFWQEFDDWRDPADPEYCTEGGHWRLVNANPYADYMRPIGWWPLPPISR